MQKLTLACAKLISRVCKNLIGHFYTGRLGQSGGIMGSRPAKKESKNSRHKKKLSVSKPELSNFAKSSVKMAQKATRENREREFLASFEDAKVAEEYFANSWS